MALASPTLYQNLYGQGESEAGGQTATGTTIKPPTATSTFKALSTTAPKTTYPAPTGGAGAIGTTANQATQPVPNSPVTRTGAIPPPAPVTQAPPTGGPGSTPNNVTYPVPWQGTPITPAPAPSTPAPTGGAGGTGGFTGPARTWFDSQSEANKQKAFAVWNSWNETQRQAFLKLSATQQQVQLQGIMGLGGGGTTPPPTGGGGGGGASIPGTGGNATLPNIAGFPVPGNAPPWQAPDQTATNAAQNQLLLNVLQHPESMTDEGVAALHQQQMEQILAQQQAYQQQFGQQAAQRGTYGGGYTDSLNRRLNDATTGQLTQSSRDIEIQRMMQDMEDRRAALGLSEQVMGGQMGRAATGHQQQLGTFGAELEKYFGGQDVLNAIRQRQLQEKLGMGALDIDRARLGESGRQFNLGHILDWARLRSGDELGRLGLGNQLSGQQLSFQDQLARLLGMS